MTGELRSERRTARAEQEGEAAERCGAPKLATLQGSIITTRIRAARVGKGWTIAQLSRESGVSISSLSMIERGDRGQQITLANALRIARALGARVEDLWGLE